MTLKQRKCLTLQKVSLFITFSKLISLNLSEGMNRKKFDIFIDHNQTEDLNNIFKLS